MTSSKVPEIDTSDTEARVEFWFEFASTYSYPAAMRVREAARLVGVRVDWKAFLLGPIFKNLGWEDSPFNLQPAKGRYMWRDLERICSDQGIAFRRPSVFPRNGLLAARICASSREEKWLPTFVERVYRANFAEDRDISDRDTVAGCLRDAGAEAEQVIAQALTDAGKAQLREQNEQAVRRGIFGAPSFVTGDELFWGNDRLHQAIDYARNGSAVRRTSY